MKHVCLILATFAACIAIMHAATNDYIWSQKPASGPLVSRNLTPTAGRLIGFPVSIDAPATIIIGSGLALTGSTLSATGSGGTWGTITGTLSAQTDLQTALDLKANTADLGTLATLSAIASAQITDGTIVNADISASAAIAISKLATDPTNATNISSGTLSNLRTAALSGDITKSAGSGVTTLANTTVTAGSYTAANITVDSKGRITAAASEDGSGLTALNASNLASGEIPAARMPALTGDVTTTAGGVATTIATGAVGATQLASTAVTAGSYTATNLTVDADGRITAASSGSAGGITIGTTTSNGTAGRVLYTDGTNVQAYTITGTGNVMMSASPTSTGTATFGTVATNTIIGVTQPTTTLAVGGNSNYPYATEFGSFAGHVLAIGKNVGASSSSGILIRSDYGVYFSSTQNPAIGAVDVGYERSAAGVMKIVAGPAGALRDVSVRNAQLTDYIEGAEMTPPGSAPANKGRLYWDDNGSGKTRLMVIFPSGAAQQIAIEP